jgi:hypothetical protein
MLAWWKEQLPIETAKWIDHNAAEIAQSAVDDHKESLLDAMGKVRLKNKLESALKRYLSRMCETKEKAIDGVAIKRIEQPIVNSAFETAFARLSEFPELETYEFDAVGYEDFAASQAEEVGMENPEDGDDAPETVEEKPEKPVTKPSPWVRHGKLRTEKESAGPWVRHSKPGDEQKRKSPWVKQSKEGTKGDDTNDEEDDDRVAVRTITGPGHSKKEAFGYVSENKNEAIVLDAKAKMTEWRINFEGPISEEEFVRALTYLKAEHGLTDEAAISMLETFVKVSDPEFIKTQRRKAMMDGGGLSYEQESIKKPPSKGFGAR